MILFFEIFRMERCIECGLKYKDNDVQSDRLIVLIGGLGDTHKGFYTDVLMKFGVYYGIRVFSLGLRSMPDYNYYTIHDDVEDVQKFYKALGMDKYAGVWYIGHSTGCQVLMLFASKKVYRESEVIILQAPVSDREYEESTNPNLLRTLEIARKLNEIMQFENQKEELDERKHQMVLYMRHNGLPFRADRILSLFEKSGDEDFFSIGQSTDSANRSKTKAYAVVSKSDEYMVSPINEVIEQLKRIKNMQGVYTIEADHSLVYGMDKFLKILECIINQRDIATE
ncbi:hypothetical protein NEQG_02456 [Nematocida parisii ERTm3]|uniref:Serine aminopeptidase S33 domain-containing protein n=1 Tax=Nematocida parisii (strain ERTm3) TaxID=935791 RepID=I3EDN6_NEMP3|nr:hypothetical protein NEQG_02456 [Nematocida parisii ERTm3]